MIVESAILSLCVYGLMKHGNMLKVAAIVNFISFPALLLFARTGSENIVLIILALEAVPFAFSLLILKLSKHKDYREMWK